MTNFSSTYGAGDGSPVYRMGVHESTGGTQRLSDVLVRSCGAHRELTRCLRVY